MRECKSMKGTYVCLLSFTYLSSVFVNADEGCKSYKDRIQALEHQMNQLWSVIGKPPSVQREDLLTPEYHEAVTLPLKDKRLLLTDPDVLHGIQAQEQDLQTKVQDLENKYRALQDKYQTTSAGAVFVQWGKSSCPDNTSELVYSGYIGGSFYNEKGGTVSSVCLSPDPIFGDWLAVPSSTHMHGTELDTNVAGPDTYTQDNTCAVCKSKVHSSTVMIPGRNECYSGWKKQYGGYLMSGHLGSTSKETICFTEHPDFVVGGGDNDNGNLLYPIKAVCGSLECPPYVNGKLLTCVVCTK